MVTKALIHDQLSDFFESYNDALEAFADLDNFIDLYQDLRAKNPQVILIKGHLTSMKIREEYLVSLFREAQDRLATLVELLESLDNTSEERSSLLDCLHLHQKELSDRLRSLPEIYQLTFRAIDQTLDDKNLGHASILVDSLTINCLAINTNRTSREQLLRLYQRYVEQI